MYVPYKLTSWMQLFEKQRSCRNAARKLVEEMDDLLIYGVDKLEDMLKINIHTRRAFQSVAGVFEELSAVIQEENKGMVAGFFREYYCLRSIYTLNLL